MYIHYSYFKDIDPMIDLFCTQYLFYNTECRDCLNYKKFNLFYCCMVNVGSGNKRFYTRGTLRGIRISRLAKIPTLPWLRSLN